MLDVRCTMFEAGGFEAGLRFKYEVRVTKYAAADRLIFWEAFLCTMLDVRCTMFEATGFEAGWEI